MKTKFFSGSWLFSRTLKTLILVLLITSVVMTILIGCTPATSVLVVEPIVTTNTPLIEIVGESTATAVPTATLFPTMVVTPEPTTMPENFGWPILQEMPYGEERAEIEASLAKDPNLVKGTPSENERFMIADVWGLWPLLYNPNTGMLPDYSNKSLPDDLYSYLNVWYRGSHKFYVDTGTSGNPAMFAEQLDGNLPIMFKYPFVVYEYANSTSSSLCQFFEAGTLAGYGLGEETVDGQPSDIPTGIAYLVERFGDSKIINDADRLYCSNFDPVSNDFLTIAKAKGYDTIVAQVLEKLK